MAKEKKRLLPGGKVSWDSEAHTVDIYKNYLVSV